MTMTYRHGLYSGAAATLLVVGAVAAGWYLLGPQADAAKKTSALPATVPKPFKEEQSASVTLTPEAESRLALAFGEAVRKPMRRQARIRRRGRRAAGEIGHRRRALAGKLALSGEAPHAGETVKKGQAIFQLLPLLDPVGRATLTASKLEADGLVQNAEEQVKLAEIAVKREGSARRWRWQPEDGG